MQDALASKHSGVPGMRIAAWILMVLGMWTVLKLGLVVTLLSGLLVFHLSQVLASPIDGRLPPGRARALAVIALSVVIIGVLVLAGIGIVSFFRTETGGPDALLARLMGILNSSRHQLPALLQPYIPEDMPALRSALNEWAAEHRRQLGVAGTSVVQISVRVLIGMVLGAMIALYDDLPLPRMGPLARELLGRTDRLAMAFRQVVFAQLKISLLNTLFTAVFLLGVLPLFGVHLPLAKTLVLITFVAGLLPVVGNVVSNTVITIVALSVSFYVALAALLFLIVIHKLEYFLNARIVGGEIRAHAWELLLAMLVMEAAFGLSGLVAAPVFYAYVKRELVDQGWI
ncbi:AI-2E family transporter [Stenotrophomonas mori]|uniref:AI-2E family transporter n=1 Tax=Stenotrophomonas mori TaxID=2871096 RepID=A0ABT0SKK7_9GAMM|nr:AI-2E family transporter [Stenotrophomonas mori]MCL7715877.1 AI-2E family transporter [Stenotrophomonas mori]